MCRGRSLPPSPRPSLCVGAQKPPTLPCQAQRAKLYTKDTTRWCWGILLSHQHHHKPRHPFPKPLYCQLPGRIIHRYHLQSDDRDSLQPTAPRDAIWRLLVNGKHSASPTGWRNTAPSRRWTGNRLARTGGSKVSFIKLAQWVKGRFTEQERLVNQHAGVSFHSSLVEFVAFSAMTSLYLRNKRQGRYTFLFTPLHPVFVFFVCLFFYLETFAS